MMHMMAAAALLLAPASEPCLTRAEIGDLAVTFLPIAVEGAANACRAQLGETAFLNSGAIAYVEQLKRAGDGRHASAMKVLQRIMGKETPDLAGNPAMLPVMMHAMAAGMLGKTDVRDCGNVDSLAESLSAFPVENMGQAAAALLALAKVGEKGKGPTICPL